MKLVKWMPFVLVFLLLCGTAVFAQSVAATDGTPETNGSVPPDFVSDGCTFFPDGNYVDCCFAHDRDYYAGGSMKERRASDKRLYRCVRSKKAWYNKLVAPVMYVGVRTFGTSYLPTRFRWGFGKKKKRKTAEKPRKKAGDSN